MKTANKWQYKVGINAIIANLCVFVKKSSLPSGRWNLRDVRQCYTCKTWLMNRSYLSILKKLFTTKLLIAFLVLIDIHCMKTGQIDNFYLPECLPQEIIVEKHQN